MLTAAALKRMYSWVSSAKVHASCGSDVGSSTLWKRNNWAQHWALWYQRQQFDCWWCRLVRNRICFASWKLHEPILRDTRNSKYDSTVMVHSVERQIKEAQYVYLTTVYCWQLFVVDPDQFHVNAVLTSVCWPAFRHACCLTQKIRSGPWMIFIAV